MDPENLEQKNECPSSIKQLKLIKMAIAERNRVWQQKYMTEKSDLKFECQILQLTYPGIFPINSSVYYSNARNKW